MARPLQARIEVTGTLIAQTPLHVGGLGGEAGVDLTLAQDGLGRDYLPGTSLAGAFRAWCHRALGKKVTDEVWGWQKAGKQSSQTPGDSGQETEGAQADADETPPGATGQVSWLTVADAPVTSTPGREVRDGVGIDRVTGAAAPRVKFDRAILPAGTTLPLKLRLVIPAATPEKANQARAVLGHLLAALQAGEIRLGAATTRGLGRVKLQGTPTLREVNPSTAAGVLALVAGLEASQDSAAVTAPTIESLQAACTLEIKRPLEITIAWQPVGPLMVKAGHDGLAVDGLPLVSARGNGLAPVLPGSSLKGVFRARAEQIVRTVLGLDAVPVDDQHPHFEQHDVPLVDELFGNTGDDTLPQDATWGPGRGALAFDDCYATTPLEPKLWQEVERAGDDGALRTALDKATAPARATTPEEPKGDAWQQAYHVAIDRWTGGAAENLLFSSLEPLKVDWEPLRLSLDRGRLRHDDAAQALLLLLLRELQAGRLPLGYGTRRGYGTVEVESIVWDGQTLDDTTLRAVLDEKRGCWEAWLDEASTAAGATATPTGGQA